MRATRSHRRSAGITVQIVKRFLFPPFSPLSFLFFFGKIHVVMRRFNWKRIKPSCRLTRSRAFCPFYIQVKRRRIDLTRAHPTLSGKSSLTAGFICQQDKINCSKQLWERINVSQLFLLAYDCFIFSFNMDRANCSVDEFMNRARIPNVNFRY